MHLLLTLGAMFILSTICPRLQSPCNLQLQHCRRGRTIYRRPSHLTVQRIHRHMVLRMQRQRCQLSNCAAYLRHQLFFRPAQIQQNSQRNRIVTLRSHMRHPERSSSVEADAKSAARNRSDLFAPRAQHQHRNLDCVRVNMQRHNPLILRQQQRPTRSNQNPSHNQADQDQSTEVTASTRKTTPLRHPRSMPELSGGDHLFHHPAALASFSNAIRAFPISSLCFSAQIHTPQNAAPKLDPSFVNSYSTLGGITG